MCIDCQHLRFRKSNTSREQEREINEVTRKWKVKNIKSMATKGKLQGSL